MDPAVTRALHDAFRKALEDPEFVKLMDKFDQDISYLNSEDYAALARKIFEEERAAIQRLGLKM
jgi:tripartite-type tricarboxylate transporter receptor subunit TctC